MVANWRPFNPRKHPEVPPRTAPARPKHGSLQRMLFVSTCRTKRFAAEGRPSTKTLSSRLLKSVFPFHLCKLCMCRETTPKECQHPTANTIRKVSVQLSAYTYIEINKHKKTEPKQICHIAKHIPKKANPLKTTSPSPRPTPSPPEARSSNWSVHCALP